MQSRTHNRIFDVNFGFGTENLLVQPYQEEAGTFPPEPGNFLLLNGGQFLLLSGGNFLLL